MATLPSSALLLALAWLAPQGAKKGPDLSEARKQLNASDEATFNLGARACSAANNLEGTELLLEKLGGSQPHFRDIAFEHLEKITDPYAIGLVENWVETHKDEMVRAWCADLLGAYFGKAKTAPLLKAVQENSIFIKTAAARALGRLQAKEAGGRIGSLKSSPDPLLRATAAITVARVDPKSVEGLVKMATGDKDSGVRAACLAALPEIAPNQVLGACDAVLKTPTSDWRARLTAVECLAKLRTKESVALLVRQASDARRAVANLSEKSLIAMTGKSFHGGKAWQEWWEAQGGTFELPAAGATGQSPVTGPATTGVFFDLPVDSDHVAFLIDRGATMSAQALNLGITKMEAVIKELENTLKALPKGNTFFNVYAYSSEPTAWERKPQPLNDKTIADSLQFLKKQPLAGEKNIWAALEAVLADPDIDTVFLMSDGEPQIGTYVHYNRVVNHLQRRNVLHRMVVHTVSVSDPSWSDGVKEWYRSQLREIAKGTGGKYVEK